MNTEYHDVLNEADGNESSDSDKMGFTIKIMSIENVTSPMNIKIKVDFNELNVGVSNIIDLDGSETQVNWEIFYEIPDLTESVIDSLIAHPFLFSVLNEDKQDFLSATPPKKGKKNLNKESAKQRAGSKSPKKGIAADPSPFASRKSSSSQILKLKKKLSKTGAPEAEQQEVHGMASLDVLPLLLGRDQMGEALIVYPTDDYVGSKAITWANLLRIQVFVTGRGGITRRLADSVTNILLFTLESLHNVTPQFSENVQVATVLPRGQECEVIKFEHSSVITDPTAPKCSRKMWFGLSGKKGRGVFSSYKVCENTNSLINTMDNVVSDGDKSLDSLPRLQWYQLRRSLLDPASQTSFQNKILVYQCWPLEVFFSTLPEKRESSEAKSKSDKKSTIGGSTCKSWTEKSTNHFMTFLDLTPLLYPGVTSARVASQLFTYIEDFTEKRFGTQLYMFDVPQKRTSTVGTTKTAKHPKTAESKKDQSRVTTPKSKKKESVQIIEDMIEEEPLPTPEPEPVCNADGKPLFIVVHVELLKPLVQKKHMNAVLSSIEQLIPPRPQPTKQELKTVSATKGFESCIEGLIHVVHDEYQIFHDRNNGDVSCKNFLMHLYITGSYTKMKESMMEHLRDYVKEVIGLPDEFESMKIDHQEELMDIYKHLVMKMCSIVKSQSSYDMNEYDPFVTCDDLKRFVAESIEEDDVDKAQEYLLQRIDNGNCIDPQPWVDYAKFWMRRQEFEKAGDCAREAIAINTKHVPALFFHGLLSWLTEDFVVAEMFLLAAVSFDTHFLEGWIALHMFHKQMNNHLDAATELVNGKMCIGKTPRHPTDSMKGQCMAWSSNFAMCDRVYLLTAIHMIKLSFPELAEHALSYDLLLHGKTTCYLYYLAVSHYEQARYQDSLIHVEEAMKTIFDDHQSWSSKNIHALSVLKGHNLYKLQDMHKAKMVFSVAIACTDDTSVNDLSSIDESLVSLLYLRLGNILMAEGGHKEAQEYFLIVCKCNPTPLSWLGLGITAFMDGDMDNAELALKEANMLDCRMSRVWGYLALVNLLMGRPKVYYSCLLQASRHGLNDPVILERIQHLSALIEERDV